MSSCDDCSRPLRVTTGQQRTRRNSHGQHCIRQRVAILPINVDSSVGHTDSGNVWVSSLLGCGACGDVESCIWTWSPPWSDECYLENVAQRRNAFFVRVPLRCPHPPLSSGTHNRRVLSFGILLFSPALAGVRIARYFHTDMDSEETKNPASVTYHLMPSVSNLMNFKRYTLNPHEGAGHTPLRTSLLDAGSRQCVLYIARH